MLLTEATSGSFPAPWPSPLEAPTPLSKVRTRSSSTRTSTACNPMGADACCFATLRSGAFISTTRLIPTSPRPGCTWARSAWNVRGPGRRPSLCGPRKGFCPWFRVANSPADWPAAGTPPWNWTGACARTRKAASNPWPPARPNSTSWSGRSRSGHPQSSDRARQIFAACAARNLHLALVQLPEHWFRPVSDPAQDSADRGVTCLRSVLMKPEHERWLDRIWAAYTDACQGIRVEGCMPQTTSIGADKENVLIRAGACSVTLLPQLGGKVASIVVNGRELLQTSAGSARTPYPYDFIRPERRQRLGRVPALRGCLHHHHRRGKSPDPRSR